MLNVLNGYFMADGKFWKGLGNVAGAIGSAAPIIGPLIQNIQDRKNAKRTLTANKELADYQYSKDLEMWNLQNEYNSPEKQMERFGNAGLNPNLIYGQGNAGNAGSLPSYHAPTAQMNYSPAFDPMSSLGAFMDLQLKQAQIDQVKSMTEKRGLDVDFLQNTLGVRSRGESFKSDLLRNRSEGQSMQNRQFESLAPFNLDIRAEESRRSGLLTDKVFNDIVKTKKGIEYQNLQNEWYVAKLIGQFGLGVMNTLPKYFGVGKMGSFNRQTRERRGK